MFTLDSESYDIRYFNLSDFLSNFGNPALWECPIQQGVPILLNLAFIAILWIGLHAFLAGIRATIFNITLSGGEEEKIKKARDAVKNLIIGGIIFILSAWFIILFARGLTNTFFNIFDTSLPQGPFRLVDKDNVSLFRCQPRDIASLDDKAVEPPVIDTVAENRKARDLQIANQANLRPKSNSKPKTTSPRLNRSAVDPSQPIAQLLFKDNSINLRAVENSQAFGAAREVGVPAHRGLALPGDQIRFPFRAYVREVGLESEIEEQSKPKGPKTARQTAFPHPGGGTIALYVPEFKKTFIFRHIVTKDLENFRGKAMPEDSLTIRPATQADANYIGSIENQTPRHHLEILQGDPTPQVASTSWQLEASNGSYHLDPALFLAKTAHQAWQEASGQ